MSLFSKQWVSEWTGLTWLIRFWFLLLPGRCMLLAPELNHLLGTSRHVHSSGVLLDEVLQELATLNILPDLVEGALEDLWRLSVKPVFDLDPHGQFDAHTDQLGLGLDLVRVLHVRAGHDAVPRGHLAVVGQPVPPLAPAELELVAAATV